MKLIAELNEKPIKGDMLIFNGKQWVLIKKAQVLYENDEKIVKINQKLEKIDEILVKIDQKLASHHNILQKLTNKGE